MITKMFKYLKEKTIDAYIDDMLVKSKNKLDHLKDLVEVFKILKEYKLRLNTAKCAFRVSSSKFLEQLVTRGGIKANSEQIVEINDLLSPKNAKEV